MQITFLIDLFNSLTPIQRRQLYVLQILVVLMALCEIAGAASIGAFMAVISDATLIQRNEFLSQVYALSGAKDFLEFTVSAGMVVAFILISVASVSIIATRSLTFYGIKIGTEIGGQLYRYYMHQPWLFHASGSSAQLTKQIATEADRVSGVIITPLMQLNAKLALAMFMSLAIVIFNPTIAITGLAVFALSYLTIYKLVRSKLARNGPAISETSIQRFKLMSEGFGGIKDVLLLGRQQDFVQRFNSTSDRYARSVSSNQFLVLMPRYIIEAIAYVAFIILVLYLIKSGGGNTSSVLPVLAVYAVAGFKLMPAFQQIYSNVAQIRGNLSAFESIKRDLLASRACPVINLNEGTTDTKMEVKHSIELLNIDFSYPEKAAPVLHELNMTIGAKQLVGLVGKSGAGKTTAVDLILGLIRPGHGSLVVDGVAITSENLRPWQNTLGYVSQSIFLSDASITENIAFGLPRDRINIERVYEVAKLAHLDEFIKQLPEGLDTRVGERGVQLSGGQRQRIGIARSLYHDAEVLIFDEATSALDGITEKLIMDAIHDFAGSKTLILIAHRLQTVKQCDVIFFMDHGRVIDQGTYDELLERNASFKKMAMHA